VSPQHSCRQHPRLHQYLRVFNRDVVQDYIALTRESLHDMHLIGVEETTASQPCRIDERDGVEQKRLALPTAHGVPQIRSLDRLLGIVLAAIGRYHAIFAVSASSIASLVEKDHVLIRLHDAPGWALPWDS